MVQWKNIFSWSGNNGTHNFRDELSNLLPISANEEIASAFPAAEVTKVALRLKYQIEQIIPCELEEWKITKANSPVITRKVCRTAKEAGGKDYASCVVFCLLVCNRWFKRQASLELWDAELYNVRATACEVLAKKIIEDEGHEEYLMLETLLKRYSIVVDGQETVAANVIERAVDLHTLLVIGSSGYQKCISYLWRGWLVQDDQYPANFIPYDNKANTYYWSHFNPDRMRAPQYQNAVQVFFSVLYLVLYTAAINTINSTGDLDIVEGILYIMTAGFLFDEIAKLWKDKSNALAFGIDADTRNTRATLYALLAVSFITRLIALGHPVDDHERKRFNELSYNFLAFSAPMFWLRLLLYLDTFRFFGAMLVILKVMMKESLIFFALLVVICIGFLQAFVGLHQVDDGTKVTTFLIQAMANSVMQSPDFTGFEGFAPPFGIILYYLYTFVVMVVLLNILIALFNSAYEAVTDNSIDEWMALFALKTIQFVRAPDENVFLPFNLIEVFCLIIPFEWWMSTPAYNRLNNAVMAVIYTPLLLITAYIETKEAHAVVHNRRHGEADDDTVEEWEPHGQDFEADGWAKAVEATKPNVETDAAVIEIRELKVKIGELQKMVRTVTKMNGGEHG